MIRQPLVVVLGHVDHGKTSLLDKIRATAIAQKEAGGITQCVSASSITIDTIKKICGNTLSALKKEIIVPGLLFIDTPGHAAFTHLRKRGGNIADIAILVVDINEGLKAQTKEAIEILRQYRTPFVIAANKIDMIAGWHKTDDGILKGIDFQSSYTKEEFEKKFYDLVAQLSEFNFNAERFDRVDDYTKQLAIVPVSAKTGEGIKEVLMILIGLTQKYMEDKLTIDEKSEGKGSILEIKELKGVGKTLEVILYDGTIKVNDVLVIAGITTPIITKVKSLFVSESEKKGVCIPVKLATASCGVRISADNMEDAVSGMPIRVANTNLEKVKRELQEEIEEVLAETDNAGIIIKAESLGSLEALSNLLRQHNIKIKRASIGDVTKKDISEAEADQDPLNKVILAFNVKSNLEGNAKIISSDIIYKLVEEVEQWHESESKGIESKQFEKLIKPCKLLVLPHCIFRQSNPAIVGVDVKIGTLKVDTPLMKNDGKEITSVLEIQNEKKNISEAEQGKQIAVSLDKITVGRQLKENDYLYSAIPENDFRKLKELKRFLTAGEMALMKEIAEIKRKEMPMWGV